MVFRAAGDDALEHIRQIGLRVETIEFGGVEKRGRDCRSTIATGEKRVLRLNAIGRIDLSLPLGERFVRTFLQFLLWSGLSGQDLARFVPRTPCYRLAHLPPGLAWEDIRRAIDAIDVTTPVGMRKAASEARGLGRRSTSPSTTPRASPKRWLGLSEQFFRFDKWNPCRGD